MMLTPALAINDTLKVVGKVPTVAGLKPRARPGGHGSRATASTHPGNQTRFVTLSLCIFSAA